MPNNTLDRPAGPHSLAAGPVNVIVRRTKQGGRSQRRIAFGGEPMAREFSVIIERDAEGYYVASAPALRGCHTQATSLDELMVRGTRGGRALP